MNREETESLTKKSVLLTWLHIADVFWWGAGRERRDNIS